MARLLGLRFVAKSLKGGAPPTAEASEYKLFSTELSKRVADTALDLAGPGSQLRVHTPDAQMRGRAESREMRRTAWYAATARGARSGSRWMFFNSPLIHPGELPEQASLPCG